MSKKDINLEYNYFFEDAVAQLEKVRTATDEMKTMIENTTLIKRTTKKGLLEHLDSISTETTAIWDRLGQLGRVR